jgi:carbonic anhydrase
LTPTAAADSIAESDNRNITMEEPMAEGTFATAINCMDGRVQQPVIDYLKQKYNVDYVDMITEAGPDGLIANGSALIENIRNRVAISVEKHGSGVVMIVGHQDCAGNPVSDDEHKEHVRRSVETIRSWGYPADVIGAWIGKDWKVEIIVE